jgi:hypothetical protein
MAVTPRAPSSTSRAGHGRGSSLTLGKMKRFLAILMTALLSSTSCFADALDQNAKATELKPPSYPAAELQRGVGGIATVVVRIDEKGALTVDRVMGSLHPFIAVAAATAKTWKFTPARRDGKPAPDVLEFIISFDAKKGVEVIGPLYRG